MAAVSAGAKPPRSMRWLRLGLALLPLAMAAALALTVLSSYRNVHSVLSTVARGQGQAFLSDVTTALRQGGEDSANLESLLARNRAAGLRCIAILDPELLHATVAGTCSSPAALLPQATRRTPPGEVVEIGARVRMIGHLPPAREPRPSGGRRPPDGDGPSGAQDPSSRWPPPRPREAAGRERGQGPPRALLIEFEPVAREALAAAAARTLGLGGAAALALAAMAVASWRLQLRAESHREQLERDRQLAALGEMSAVLAHEIRNPLASMKGHAQLLAEKLEPGTPEHDKASRVVREILRLERLSRDLLSLVRANQVERRDADPAGILREAVAAAGATIIDVDAARAPARWSLDEGRLHQVLINLLRNAVQASPPGRRVDARVTQEGQALVYSVRDRGPGVPPGEEERIFQPFHTTRTRGTGLGLAVARKIVGLHGGTLSVSNHAEGGAVFRVSIPRR